MMNLASQAAYLIQNAPKLRLYVGKDKFGYSFGTGVAGEVALSRLNAIFQDHAAPLPPKAAISKKECRMNVTRFKLLLLCLISIFLGGCAMAPDKPTSASHPHAHIDQTVEQAAEQVIPVLQTIARLAKQPNAYSVHRIELSATLQLQARLIELANRNFAAWSEEQEQRYIQLVTDGLGDSASLFIGSSSQELPKVAVAASDVNRDSARSSAIAKKDSECICPFCGTWCSCPLICNLITDSPETCENFKQWYLTTSGWMPFLCKPTGRVLPVCYASDAVCNLSPSDASLPAQCQSK